MTAEELEAMGWDYYCEAVDIEAEDEKGMKEEREPTRAHRRRQERLADALIERMKTFFGGTLEDHSQSGSVGTDHDPSPEYIEVASRGAVYRVTVECIRGDG